ncbi:hydroxyacid dehydrogenase [Meiothermus ruber]|jgi:D-3-phosphoglycerate dehydrogenase|uniref:D-isomer specific 2-hydroxyacid dehydrogenase NAD-binding protein n=1 Tax=Meiothermus ruber (strain ATCC 35948 / DSM 1279 / VKM B-1258 / 21) TaxID=504728 RepID=D3PMA6_MEIRD|nr:hydroxyacid dehydrogenase [Meiothermus ruber]ADD29212.1 D-isomer specific 2-hydroxyacid dehydrogenase NAD-binding protein [Meiothermus ruber DSM 1279]AGK05337.1 D-isomer specific 2-hydroxyacid dehydrogenase NAD-binding protein [Meiothermus ruber DSM 1279]MCL6531510.1 hydroxyacid dehydrogenase [Meiothermus ruber]
MIVVCEFITPSGLQRLQQSGLEVHYDPHLWKDREALKARLAGASALIVRNQTQVNAELLAAAPRLRVVGRLGVGLDNINQPDLKAAGVQLYFARGINANGVAEYVMAAMLHLARNIAGAAAHVAEGGWNRTAFGGFELSGKTLGLVGLGEVGLRVARRARAFGMRVVASDPMRLPWESAVEDLGIELVSTPEVLRRAQFLSLHAPLTPETRELIRAETLAAMPRGSFLINTARGELVQQADLVAALRSGHLAGAVLDVVDPEPLPPEHPLRGVENLWITPHVAGLTAEAQEAVGLRVAEGVLNILGVA